MKQIYKVVNITRKEYINPQKFCEGGNFTSFFTMGHGVLSGLSILLADGLVHEQIFSKADNEILGRWAGDKIVIAGHLGQNGKWLKSDYGDTNIYDVAEYAAKDMSIPVLEALCTDEDFLNVFLKYYRDTGNHFDDVTELLNKLTNNQIVPPNTKATDTWNVIGSTGSRYTVSTNSVGDWSCTCAHYIYRRKECKHISKLKANYTPQTATI